MEIQGTRFEYPIDYFISENKHWLEMAIATFSIRPALWII